MSSAKWLDLVERAGWTFAQALAATIYAAGQSTNFQSINWSVALTGAAIAALLAMLKVAGTNASQVVQTLMAVAAAEQAQQAQKPATPAPAERAPQHERPE